MSLTGDEVLERAQRWAFLHKRPENRPKMDAVLNGLNAEDQRRVYLCGQRICGGLPIKIIPAANNRKEEKDESKDKRKRQSAAAPKSTGATEKGKAVGANPRAKGSSRSRKDSGKKK